MRAGLDLEPPDHGEHAAVGSARGEHTVLVPQMQAIEGGDIVPLSLWHAQSLEQRLDVILRHRDVLGHEPVEQVGAAIAIEAEQHVRNEMPEIHDRAVDVEDDRQLIGGMPASNGCVVIREGSHPVGARRPVGEDHDRSVAIGTSRTAPRRAWFIRRSSLGRRDGLREECARAEARFTSRSERSLPSSCGRGPGDAPCRPGDHGRGERRRREHHPAAFTERFSSLRVETGHVGTGRADAERERTPPLVEARVLDADRQCGLFDLVQPRGSEEFAEMALACTREPGLVGDRPIERSSRLPEEAEWSSAAGVIPHACRDHPALAHHASHLPHSRKRVRHEMHDELGQGGIEAAVVERKVLCGGADDIDLGVACTGNVHERLRWVHGRDAAGIESARELAGKRTGAASHIEDLLRTDHPRELGEPGGERGGVPAHEAVVRLSPHAERHHRTIAASAPAKGCEPFS